MEEAIASLEMTDARMRLDPFAPAAVLPTGGGRLEIAELDVGYGPGVPGRANPSELHHEDVTCDSVRSSGLVRPDHGRQLLVLSPYEPFEGPRVSRSTREPFRIHIVPPEYEQAVPLLQAGMGAHGNHGVWVLARQRSQKHSNTQGDNQNGADTGGTAIHGAPSIWWIGVQRPSSSASSLTRLSHSG